MSLTLSSPGFVGSLALIATGGTISSVTFEGVVYTVHTFASSGSFVVQAGAGDGYVLVVAGGGSGGTGWSNIDGSRYGGSGGAGGWLLNGSDNANISTATPIILTPQTFAITVGGPAQNSTAFGTTTTRGGNGGSNVNGGGVSGGSGGGGSSDFGAGGAGTAGPPRQGFGGTAATGGNSSGVGGGAGGQGSSATGVGGPGKAFLGTMFALGGNRDSTPAELGSGGASRLNTTGLSGRGGVVVVAYRTS